jgi:NADH:ubiquinone oxidoreductase subunit 4 (subunit M)
VKWPPPHRRAQAAKLAAVLAAEVAMAPPMIVLTFLLGCAPEPLLALQNRFRQRSLRWLHPEAAAPTR